MTLRACLHEGGGPQIGEVKSGGSPHLSCKRDQIKMRDYLDRLHTPPKRVASPTWDPPPPYKKTPRSNGVTAARTSKTNTFDNQNSNVARASLFCTFLCGFFTTKTCKIPHFAFYRRRKQAKTKFYFSF